MSGSPKQSWRLEIAKLGDTCRIFLNDEPLYPHTADLHMTVNQRTTLMLQYPIYGRYGTERHTPPTYQVGDPLRVEGSPGLIILDIDGRRFRVVELVNEGDRDDGLFGAR